MKIQITLQVISYLLFPLLLGVQTSISIPSKMEFANVKLKITPDAKAEIQKTLTLLTQNEKYFKEKIERVNRYIHFIEKTFKEEKIPDDFKYLAIQESAFISDAVSSADAVGFWQFKKASAQEFGLRVDRWVDERKNIIASTIAAAKYLRRSNLVFDNWLLSLQSYLQGLQGTRNVANKKWYGSIKMIINSKTHWYVKRYIAHKLAFQHYVGTKYQKKKAINLAIYQGKKKTLAEISKEVKVDYHELKRFNKWLNQPTIPQEKTYAVIYPLYSKKKVVKQHYLTKSSTPKPQKKKITKNKSVRKFAYTSGKPIKGNIGSFPKVTRDIAYAKGKVMVNGIPAIFTREGETWQTLAKKTGISIAKIKKYNDLGKQALLIPKTFLYLKRKKRKGKVHYHIVREGETLWSISQDYGIRIKKLIQKNRFNKSEVLEINRVLWLRFIRPAGIPIEHSTLYPPINHGWIKAKKQLEGRLLSPTSTSLPPQNKTKSMPSTSSPTPQDKKEEDFPQIATKINTSLQKKIEHIVKSQETFFTISRKYGVTIDDILVWNQLNIMDGLKIGQKLKLVINKKDLTLVHQVEKGETVWSISRKYGVKIEQILEWNNKNSDLLSVGEELKINKKHKNEITENEKK